MDVRSFLAEPDSNIYLEHPLITLDFETSNLDKGSAQNPENSIVLTAWSVDGEVSSRFGNEYQIQDVVDLVEERILVAHNAKFELKWLKRAGCDLTKVLVWDTLLAEYVFNGNRNLPLDLGSVAQRYGLPSKEAYVDICMKGGVCPSEMPKSFLERRCVYDIKVTEELFKRQLRRAQQEGKLEVILTRCLLTPVLADIESNGMHPDPERVLPEYYEVQEQHLKIKDQLSALYPDVNWNSPKQVGELLYDTLGFPEVTNRKGNPIRTPGGARKADADIIGALKARTKEQKQLQELILEEALLNTKLKFLQKLKDCCESEGVVYANFNQSITQTHRLSSNGTKYKIQFQNMAREYKKLFCARYPEWYMGEQDGAQLEFRVAAYLGQDQQAVQDIRNNEDVHQYTADTITGAGQSTDRQEAKAHCFPVDRTEFLTPRGWRSVNELSLGDEVISYDQTKESLVIDTIIDTVEPFYDDVMRIHNSHWSFDCTPDHRWFGQKRVDTGKGRVFKKGIVAAKDITTSWRITTTAEYNGGADAISPEDAARIAWIEADGTWQIKPITGRTSQGKDGRRRGCYACVIQKKQEGIQHVNRLFGDVGKEQRDSIFVWNVPAEEARRLLKIRGENPDWEQFVLDLSPEARYAFLEAICISEGTRRKHGQWRIAQNSGPFCEAIKLCGYLCGYDIRVAHTVLRTGNPHEQITLRTRRHVTCQRIKKKVLEKELVSCVVTNTGGCVVKQGDTITASHNTFKPLYGGTSGTKAEQAYYKAFKEKYSNVARTQQEWIEEVLRNKKLRTVTGLEFFWPKTQMQRSGYVTNTASICNYPVQSLATADIIPIALVYFWHEVKYLQLRSLIVNTIHDSIITEVPPDETEQISSIGVDCLTHKVYNYLRLVYSIDFNVPLGVGTKFGAHWSEGKEVKINVEPAKESV